MQDTDEVGGAEKRTRIISERQMDLEGTMLDHGNEKKNLRIVGSGKVCFFFFFLDCASGGWIPLRPGSSWEQLWGERGLESKQHKSRVAHSSQGEMTDGSR